MCTDAAASAPNSTPSVPSTSEVQVELSENTEETCSIREGHPCSTVLPPHPGTGRELTDASRVSVNGTAQPEEALGGDKANDPEMETTDVQRTAAAETLTPATQSSQNTGVNSFATAAPSLPPFFKGVATSTGAATAASLTTGAVDEAKTTQVVESTQVHGVGYAGESAAPKTRCVCMIM